MDFFLAKFAAGGSNLIFSSYLGGSGEESTETHELALDANGNAYGTGYTNSLNYPTTAGAFQRASGGGYDAPIAKISAHGTQLLASSSLGGLSGEGGQGIDVDPQGNLVVFGLTSSSNFPTTSDGFQRAYHGNSDFFVARLMPDLSQLLYSTYLGGSGPDQGRAGYVDANGNLIVRGMTQSNDWPILNATQTVRRGVWDGAVARFSLLTLQENIYLLLMMH